MDRVKERLKVAQKALKTMEEIVSEKQPTAIQRDAAIQRFEYTFEAVWKAAQMYLKEFEGVESGSPKSTARACFQVGILNNVASKSVLSMIDDRNLTVHTYNESLAVAIYSRLESYARLMEEWLAEIAKRLEV